MPIGVYPRRQRPLAERLEESCIPEPNSGCMLWTGNVNAGGYGIIHITGRQKLAHRMSWQTFRGEIPAGKLICHKCDVPGCINPNHLFVGAHIDNARDKIAKGRAKFSLPDTRGDKNPQRKITAEGVRLLRAFPKERSEIAARYGISDRNARKILSGEIWRHV